MYQAPKLIQLGKVENLTLGFGGTLYDGNQWTHRLMIT